MSKPKEDAELIALSAAVFARCTDIQAANKQREVCGHAMAYDGYDDDGELKALTAELKARGRLK